MTDETMRLYEVRLDGLKTVRVVTTSHERAMSAALKTHPIKADGSVVIAVLPDLLLPGTWGNRD